MTVVYILVKIYCLGKVPSWSTPPQNFPSWSTPPQNFGEKEAKIGYPWVFSRAACQFFGKSFDPPKIPQVHLHPPKIFQVGLHPPPKFWKVKSPPPNFAHTLPLGVFKIVKMVETVQLLNNTALEPS